MKTFDDIANVVVGSHWTEFSNEYGSCAPDIGTSNQADKRYEIVIAVKNSNHSEDSPIRIKHKHAACVTQVFKRNSSHLKFSRRG